jgi:tetratricopeptide (TPR) repeat protein
MIRVVLFLLFLLWAVRTPYAYRDSVRERVLSNDPDPLFKKENQEIGQSFLKATGQNKPGDERRNQATADLALLRAQQLQFHDAEQLYKVILVEYRKATTCDDYVVQIKLKLATTLIAQEKFDEAISLYRQVLTHDKDRLPMNSGMLARDYNNLGLALYLKASSKDRGKERTDLLDSANDFYQQALQIVQGAKQSEQTKAVILYNQHLALRDANNLTGAALAKTEANLIEKTFGRQSQLP